MKILIEASRRAVAVKNLNHRSMLLSALIGLTSFALASCSTIVRKEPPTLSHVHIGHAITGWESAPNGQGLLVAAELFGIEANANCELMLEAAKISDIDGMKSHLSNIATVINPGMANTASVNTGVNEYGLRQLMAESLVHLKIASEIFDASPNVQRTMAGIHVKGQNIVSIIDELQLFTESALESDDVDELKIFTEEIARLTSAVTGQSADVPSYGIQQFRQDIDAMIAREDPPYQTIDKYYLFSIGI